MRRGLTDSGTGSENVRDRSSNQPLPVSHHGSVRRSLREGGTMSLKGEYAHSMRRAVGATAVG